MENTDHETLVALMGELESVQVTICPPQKTPRWAKQRTARAVGTRIGQGCYMRGNKRAMIRNKASNRTLENTRRALCILTDGIL